MSYNIIVKVIKEIKMNYKDLVNYVDNRRDEGLNKLDVSVELLDDEGDYTVLKTKETYVYFDEEAADAAINDFRQQPEFVGCDKKFKQGKINKAGEVVNPDTWSVVVKFRF